jgi:RimJ/RimL family protein N-acetyltransferase
MLREYRQEDLPEIRKWVNDGQVTRFLSTIFWPPQTMVDTQQFLDRMMESGNTACNFVIADRQSERYIGQLDIFRLDYKLRQGELGMVIGDGGDRGRGLGTEALGLLLRHAFLTLGLERVELQVDMGNLGARRCYEKAGFVMEGVKRHAYYRDGSFCDLGMLSVLREEWLAQRGNP